MSSISPYISVSVGYQKATLNFTWLRSTPDVLLKLLQRAQMNHRHSMQEGTQDGQDRSRSIESNAVASHYFH